MEKFVEILIILGHMIRVQIANPEDMMCIHNMAEVVFRHTCCDILSPEQIDYIMGLGL